MSYVKLISINQHLSLFLVSLGDVDHFIVQVAQIGNADQVIHIVKEQYKIKDVDIAYDSTYLLSSYAKSIGIVNEGGSWIILHQFVQEELKHVAQNAFHQIRQGKVISD